jgi:hypothetical protein
MVLVAPDQAAAMVQEVIKLHPWLEAPPVSRGVMPRVKGTLLLLVVPVRHAAVFPALARVLVDLVNRVPRAGRTLLR